jgi:hypothetical protein
MPHVSDVRPTSHDRHDPLLVAALAADDLAGTDRDQAIALTRSCADCATLHDDLLVLARATAAALPPFPTPSRDFRLTPADAARLRPSGWRRLVAALSAPRSAVTRPLGVGLATLGLVGLLIGNVQLGGTTASQNAAAGPGSAYGPLRLAPPAASAATGGARADAAAPSPGLPGAQVPEGGLAAGPVSPAPASADGTGYAAPIITTAPRTAAGQSAPVGSDGKTTADQASSGDTDLQAGSTAGTPAAGEPFRPLNVLFGAAVVVGLGLLVAARYAGRRSA